MGKLETLKRLHASMRDKLDELTEDVDELKEVILLLEAEDNLI